MRSSARLLPDELSLFHAVRNDLYQASFELLRAPPRKASLGAARKALSADLPHLRDNELIRLVVKVLSTASVEEAATEYAWLVNSESAVPMRCANPGCRHRAEAYAAVSVLASEERVSELRVLSLLADRTLEALSSGSLPEASILTDVQGRFLANHAGVCLGQLVLGLRKGGAPLYSRVGAALGWLIEEDLRLLGLPPGRAP